MKKGSEVRGFAPLYLSMRHCSVPPLHTMLPPTHCALPLPSRCFCPFGVAPSFPYFIPVLFQALEPTTLDLDVQGAMITEYYFSSYAFKAESVNINSALVVSANLLQVQTKTPKQNSRSFLARSMNRITGSMTLGAIYVAHLLLAPTSTYL